MVAVEHGHDQGQRLGRLEHQRGQPQPAPHAVAAVGAALGLQGYAGLAQDRDVAPGRALGDPEPLGQACRGDAGTALDELEGEQGPRGRAGVLACHGRHGDSVGQDAEGERPEQALPCRNGRDRDRYSVGAAVRGHGGDRAARRARSDASHLPLQGRRPRRRGAERASRGLVPDPGRAAQAPRRQRGLQVHRAADRCADGPGVGRERLGRQRRLGVRVGCTGHPGAAVRALRRGRRPRSPARRRGPPGRRARPGRHLGGRTGQPREPAPAAARHARGVRPPHRSRRPAARGGRRSRRRGSTPRLAAGVRTAGGAGR